MTITKEIYYNVVFAFLLSLYSVQVCPHVSGLGLIWTGVSFMLFMIPLSIVRLILLKKIKNRKPSLFWVNLSYFAIIGLFVGLYNFLYREFPIESAYKIIVGAVILSALNATIYSLESSYFRTKKRISFIYNIAAFFLLIIALTGVIFVLLIMEDINLFNSVQNGSMINLVQSIIIESLFVWLVIILYLLRIIHLYKDKLKNGIKSQIESLNEIRKDNLDVIIPRFSNDEFSIIGDEVNDMILRLKEGRKIKTGFQKLTGKGMSKDLVEKIVLGDFTSEKKEMAIVFTDIKGFTAICEETEPEKFVIDLNSHFEKMVKIIDEHEGVVNKFIGDAILIYFEGPDACLRAVNASNKMIEHSIFKIGVGVHYGELLAGLIGSKDRLEYSIIGSVVNKTSRLESATRSLNGSIVISKRVYELLPINLKHQYNETKISLKGFSAEEKVWFK